MEAPSPLTIRQVQRRPSDEITLTELIFDSKDIMTFEMSSSVIVVEEEQEIPKGNFRCYMDNMAKEFFIEISSEDTMKAFSRSTLMNVLELAQEAGAEYVYVCFRKTIEKKNKYLKNFLFIGFEQLSEEEQQKITMTRTHSILKYSIVDQETEEEEEEEQP